MFKLGGWGVTCFKACCIQYVTIAVFYLVPHVVWMMRILTTKEKVKLCDMYLYLITLKQNNSTLVFALISSFGKNMSQLFFHFISSQINSEVTCEVTCVHTPPSNYFSFHFVTPIQLMVIRGNMVTVFKLKHPCVRCCAENTFIMEGSNSQKSIQSQTVCQSSWNFAC